MAVHSPPARHDDRPVGSFEFESATATGETFIFGHRDRSAVFRSLRENGPALLVPAAWLVAAGQTAGILDATLRY